MLTHSMEKMKT